MFGLPDGVKACLFDMDGVVTQTAVVPAAARKEMFDGFPRQRAEKTGTQFVPFGTNTDYDAYVDGKPRLDGLSNRQNDLVLARLAAGGVKVYAGTVSYVRSARTKRIRTAIVSSSASTKQILDTGVEAGRAGDFALVAGVDRVGQADELTKHGAGIVVQDLAELLDKDAR